MIREEICNDGYVIPKVLIHDYFRSLVNCFFKILPMKESGEDTLYVYLDSFKSELIGCRGLLNEMQHEPSFVTLLSILQFFIDNHDCDIPTVKREVFRAIRICNNIAQKFSEEG